jgi:hypothetical protein
VLGADAAFIVAEDHIHDQWRLFSIAQWLRMTGPSWLASHTSDVM